MTDVVSSVDIPLWFEDAVASEPTASETEVAGARIAFRTWGAPSETNAPDLVLVHGGAANSRWWDHLAPLLASDRRVVAIDLSGHGDSGHRSDYSPDRWADELDAVIGASGLSRPPVVVGHSLGGFVTMRLAARGTTRLAGVIIVDSPIGEKREPTPLEPDPVNFGKGRVHGTAAEVVARFRPVPRQPALPYIAAHVAENSVREVDGGWTWKFDPTFLHLRSEIPADLRGLSCPAVLIFGENGIVPPEVRHSSQQIAGVAVVEIPDAYHAIMLDQPLALLAAIRGVLAGWSSR